ncbi:MAG: transaldolase [Candidatus Omnitrophica bacterium]|nr:transaldolase [Candidatus Omnitrophota bacterium]
MQDKDRRNLESRPLTHPLKQLYELGQSPWYDNIERRLFKTGEFTELIDKYGIVGVTSNPTIFDKAISKSTDYDEQIKRLAGSNMDAYAIYDEIAIEDIGRAADMLKTIYEKTRGEDGYVSIEVLPQYANDPENTVKYAKRIFERINRKNILIKVPGTKAALGAITELIAEGINVNVTLLFSLTQYETIAKAYMDGLKKRLASGKSLDNVRSVASVFISRIDTSIDDLLESRGMGHLKGKAAVANSKLIYRRFKEIFFGPELSKLKKSGAAIQRVLWASTSTKNPSYRDVKYVEELIGPHSINTLPHPTALAFYNHGIVKSTVEEGFDEAKNILKELKSLGIDIDKICDELQGAGIKAFIDSFNSLIASIERKRKDMLLSKK